MPASQVASNNLTNGMSCGPPPPSNKLPPPPPPPRYSSQLICGQTNSSQPNQGDCSQVSMQQNVNGMLNSGSSMDSLNLAGKSSNTAKVSYRAARVEDVEELYKLLVESTKGSTKLTAEKLKDDLFSVNSFTSVEVLLEDAEIEFDTDQLQTNAPVARAVVAEVDASPAIVGYLIFHNHYTPWVGFIGFIDDIYTKPSMRRRGIGRGMFQKATDIAKASGFKSFLFNASHLSPDMQDYLMKEGNSYWYRRDETDWSVLRIEFNDLRS